MPPVLLPSLVSPSLTLMTSHTPYTSNSTKPSNPLNAARRPTPLPLTEQSSWRCHACNAMNRFTHTSALRPLGRVQCRECVTTAHFETPISNIKGFVGIEGTHFMVSLPPGQEGPPETLFGWVCCTCGRSHRRHTRGVRHDCRPSPRTPTEPRRGLENARPKFRKRVIAAFKSLANSSQKGEEDDYVAVSIPFEAFEERSLFRVVLDKECTCHRMACELCLKYKIEAEGEWVTQEVTQTTGPKFLNYFERAKVPSYHPVSSIYI
ncbi:hypothetical protein K504DRAFT_501644 [Pleomassaria siparia CBS 279.74]|uniref:Probable double zinc ribbon domain-containing protein n=1 Tax=Pleomassaria siparia CBS 279.74 TaxID=1314801 RepID=A0A6G1KC26_9PLEO|nr:hypothetical protein K504DRAFT_501644 [Pleomassaria siparia CBS 279.74]